MSAILSYERPTPLYRYRLERHIGGGGGPVAFIMVNPSTADHVEDDQTIRKVIGFAQRLDACRVIVGNLFAYRATDVRELRDAGFKAVGPLNDLHLEIMMREADRVIVAWGSRDKIPARERDRTYAISALAYRASVKLECLGVTAKGDPLHPCMISYDRPVQPWRHP